MTFQYENGRLFYEDERGKLLAEITFPTREGVANIDHTFVDSSLRGQGVAGQLMTATVAHLKAAGHKATASCSYAVKWFEEHPEEAALLKP